MLFYCGFCPKTYTYKGSLRAHEIKKHKNNKLLHSQYPLYIPLFSDCQQFCSTFINLIQKCLTSHRSTQGSKFIEFPCSENIFAFYFRNEEHFQYIHYLRKYNCIFRGLQGYERIAKLFDFEDWGRTIDKTGSETYVVFNKTNLNNYIIEEKEVEFCWKEKGNSFKYGVITFFFEINMETIEIVEE
ncbi:23318_t:CDS:1 [Gigaspora margarita]|uniref:23318_t:CDS:1 n=1 Tax=Gigaspora margarita TaxID=4874 RepID=A0ABM8W412_GIGMA|nr:23318_t:CDS:1 [Gigaspora margarita]